MIYDNRELSWLKFNMRVLKEAESELVPPLERLRFLSITTSNLDEFFMVRVGRISDSIILGEESLDKKTGLTFDEQLKLIYENTALFYKKKKAVYREVLDALSDNGIRILNAETLFDGKKHTLHKKFEKHIKPLLSAQIINSKTPFPHLENQKVYCAVHLVSKEKSCLGIVAKSVFLEELIKVGNSNEFVLTDNAVLHYADSLFPGYKIADKCLIRITRNADMYSLQDEFSYESDLRLKMKKILKKRKRLAPVRIEVSRQISKDFKRLIHSSELIFVNKNPLSFRFVPELIKRIPKELKDKLSYKAFTPQIPSWFNPTADMFSAILERDLMFSYPYDSMKPFLRFLEQASNDKDVESIKITLYRMNTNSQVIHSLIKAAEHGKKVLAVMELRARFDEENNINYSELLEENGVTVIYGPENYKVHSKICAVKRKNEYFTHFGTGNYNENTARQYTDLNLITSDETLGRDAEKFFENLEVGNLQGEYEMLCVSPFGIEEKIIEKLDELINYEGEKRAILKCNALTSKSIIDKIYEAAHKGVLIQMIVRGICCLKPDIPNLQIISIVGRFLEHSRIYAFYKGEDKEIYISSADLMTRNLRRRVETSVPLKDEKLKNEITDYLERTLADDMKASEINENGEYKLRENKNNFDSQQHFLIKKGNYADEIGNEYAGR